MSSSCAQAWNQPPLLHACQGRLCSLGRARPLWSLWHVAWIRSCLLSLARTTGLTYSQPLQLCWCLPPACRLSSQAHGNVHAKGETVQLQESRLTVGAPRAASEPVVGHSPYWLPWPVPLCSVCSQPLPLHRHLQLAPAAECVYTTSFSPHHCLPGPEPLDLRCTEGSTSPCSHCGQCYAPQQPEQMRHQPPILYLRACTTRCKVRESSSMLPP